MKLLTFLGNPGDKYQETRHNAAWIVADELFGSDGWSENKYAKALVKDGSVAGEAVTLLKPLTFMNRSGESLRYFLEKEDVEASDIVVLHDDLDIKTGSYKVSLGRGSGGHNGVQSVIDALGTKDFVRVRIGIGISEGSNEEHPDTCIHRVRKDFVLSRFSGDEIDLLLEKVPSIKAALAAVIEDGVEAAMNKYN